MSRAEGVPRGCFPCRFYEFQSLSTTWNILSVIVEEKSLLYWFSPFVFSSGLILLTIQGKCCYILENVSYIFSEILYFYVRFSFLLLYKWDHSCFVI